MRVMRMLGRNGLRRETAAEIGAVEIAARSKRLCRVTTIVLGDS